jgi:hypothetical protein
MNFLGSETRVTNTVNNKILRNVNKLPCHYLALGCFRVIIYVYLYMHISCIPTFNFHLCDFSLLSGKPFHLCTSILLGTTLQICHGI